MINQPVTAYSVWPACCACCDYDELRVCDDGAVLCDGDALLSSFPSVSDPAGNLQKQGSPKRILLQLTKTWPAKLLRLTSSFGCVLNLCSSFETPMIDPRPIA